MKTLRYLPVFPLLIALSVSCGDSNEPDVTTVADLVGAWTATKFEVTDPSGTVLPVPVDLVGPFVGGSLDITISSNGSFTGTFRLPLGSNPEPVAGTISIQGNVLTIDFTTGLDDPISGQFVLNGDVLTVTGTNLSFTYLGETITGASVILVMER